jgi:hypothetical protein
MLVDEGDFTGLPGAELVTHGLKDLRCGRESKYSLLIKVAEPRFKMLGIDVPSEINSASYQSYEHRLYSKLEEEYGDSAYSNYNSLIRRIVSFSRALAQEKFYS